MQWNSRIGNRIFAHLGKLFQIILAISNTHSEYFSTVKCYLTRLNYYFNFKSYNFKYFMQTHIFISNIQKPKITISNKNV